VLQRWRDRLADHGDEEGCYLWGADAKGVSFLNLLDPGPAISSVVDINPRKQGTYVPGTGHRVIAPEELCSRKVTTVLVMNSAYQNEIRGCLASLGLTPAIETVF